MSKITKKQLQCDINSLDAKNSTNRNLIFRIRRALRSLDIDIMSDEFDEPEPQLKQLDQSVFDGLDEKWRFAAVDGSKGFPVVYEYEPYILESERYYTNKDGLYKDLEHMKGYDTSNWQNSLIERDMAKELLEVDLSSELTGSDLTGSDYFHSNITSALLESGSKLVVCFVSNVSESNALSNKRVEVITSLDTGFNDSDDYGWQYAVPINNQGEPLTASEVGL